MMRFFLPHRMIRACVWCVRSCSNFTMVTHLLLNVVLVTKDTEQAVRNLLPFCRLCDAFVKMAVSIAAVT